MGGATIQREALRSPKGAARPTLVRVSDLETHVLPEERLSEGDHDRFAHICRKEDITRAHVTGEAIEALCGKKWVPTRNPDNFPVCPACKEALESIQNSGSN